MGSVRKFRRLNRVTAGEMKVRLEGTGDRINALIDRLSMLETYLAYLYLPKCPCGSKETTKTIQGVEIKSPIVTASKQAVTAVYLSKEIRCYYCRRILESDGAPVILSPQQAAPATDWQDCYK